MEDILHTLGFLVFQIEDNLSFRIVDDAFTVFAVLQGEKVVEVLGGADCRSAVTTDDLEDLQYKLRCQTVGRRADELPCFINEDSFFGGTVFLRFVPNIVQ